MTSFWIGLCLILLAGATSIAQWTRFIKFIFLTLILAGSGAVVASAGNVLLTGKPLQTIWELGKLYGEIPLIIDPLGAFFLVIIALGTGLCSMYMVGYLSRVHAQEADKRMHRVFFVILCASMIMVAITHHVIAFLWVWEMMTLSSFFVISLEHGRKEVTNASLYYLVAMHIGYLFILVGLLLLTQRTGQFTFSNFGPYLTSHPTLTLAVVILLGCGFGIKAGWMPLHTWLTLAHPEAPSPISALLSGVMIKLGIYGILRMLSWLGTPTPLIIHGMLGISLITAILGIIYTLSKKNLKRILAYSSIENIGIIGIALSLGMMGLRNLNESLILLGFGAVFFHIFGHSLAKMVLFFAAGAVQQQTNTRDIEKLGGLIHRMPKTAALFIMGAIAIAGLPPFGLVISKFLLLQGLFGGLSGSDASEIMILILSISIVALTSILTLFSFTRAISIVFLGQPRSTFGKEGTDPHQLMIMAMTIPMLLLLAMGFIPSLFFKVLICEPVRWIALNAGITSSFTLNNTGVSTLSIAIFVSLVLMMLIAALRGMIRKNQPVTRAKTWDCGYSATTPHMQYSGASFSEPLLGLVNRLLSKSVTQYIPKTFFPQKAHFESAFSDIMDRYIVNPIIRKLIRSLGSVTWIQTGNIQLYILYGLLFLIANMIWLMVHS